MCPQLSVFKIKKSCKTVTFFSVRDNPVYNTICEEYKNYTLLNQHKKITKNVNILHLPVGDRCRLSGDPNESIEHIFDDCQQLAHN